METALPRVAGVTSVKRGTPSPYDVWFHIPSLEEESRRLASLPNAYANTKIIQRWREKQRWLIWKRIQEIKRNTHVTNV